MKSENKICYFRGYVLVDEANKKVIATESGQFAIYIKRSQAQKAKNGIEDSAGLTIKQCEMVLK